jgi:hypothetical protein
MRSSYPYPLIISLVRYLENIPKTSVFEGEKAGTLWIIPSAFSLANVLFYVPSR